MVNIPGYMNSFLYNTCNTLIRLFRLLKLAKYSKASKRFQIAVGFCDVNNRGLWRCYPIIIGGRIVTFIILMIGLCIVAIPARLFASSLQEASKQTKM